MEAVLDYQSPKESRILPTAWISLALLLAINLLNYIDRYVLAAVEPLIREAFPNVTKTKSGWLATAFFVSYMVTAPLFGWLADRKSRWMMVGWGVLLWSIATAASGWAKTFEILLISRLFVGVGEAGYGPAAPTIISDLFPLRWRGSVISFFYVAIPVGSALGFVIGSSIGASHWGWRAAFYVVTIPGILLGILCFFFKDPPRGKVDGGTGGHSLPKLADYGHILKVRSYVINTLSMAAMTFAIGGMSFWMPDYLANHRGLGSSGGTKFGLIIVVAGLAATVIGGLAGDFIRKIYRGSYFLVSGVAILIAAPMVIGMLYVPFPHAWWLLAGAIFFLFFNTGPSNTALANVVSPSVRASAFAFNIFLIHLMGDAPAPPILGYMIDHHGWNSAFMVVAGCMVLAAVLWLIGAPSLGADEDAVVMAATGSEPS